jgi:hypothetical protein
VSQEHKRQHIRAGNQAVIWCGCGWSEDIDGTSLHHAAELCDRAWDRHLVSASIPA